MSIRDFRLFASQQKTSDGHHNAKWALDEIKKLKRENRVLTNRREDAERGEMAARNNASALLRKIAVIRDTPADEVLNIAARVAGHAALGEWNLAGRAFTPFKIAECSNCGINLYTPDAKPATSTMPCNVPGCCFEKAEDQVPLMIEAAE